MAGEVLHGEGEGEAVWGHHGLGRGPSECQGQRGMGDRSRRIEGSVGQTEARGSCSFYKAVPFAPNL